MRRERSVNMRDVALVAGVSVGTVSNFLNALSTVTEANRHKVERAIKQTGYVRNESARQLKAGRSRLIGVVVLDVGNPFYSDLALGVESRTVGAGLITMTCNSDDDLQRQNAILSALEEQRVSGIVLAPAEISPDLRSRLEGLRARGTEVVTISALSEMTSGCTVCGDDFLGGQLVGRHLVAQRHRSVAFVAGPAGISASRHRYEGLVDGMSGATAETLDTSSLEMPGLTIELGIKAGAEILGSPRPPTAIFCANDLLALGVLQYAISAGRSVPDDVAIVGYDDISFAAGAAIPLTSVRQPRRLLGARAAELLLDEIARPGAHRHENIVFPPELIVRRSSRREG